MHAPAIRSSSLKGKAGRKSSWRAFTLTRTSQVLGTPHYMAPEQVSRPLEVDHRADIYSLGVVLYEMLTGELPVGAFPPPSKQVAVDVRLDEVVLRTLEREPERRYQRVSEVKTDLENIRNPATETLADEALSDRWYGWIRSAPGGPWRIYLLALGASALWLLVYGIRFADGPRDWYSADPFAVAYPLAFLAFLAARAGGAWPAKLLPYRGRFEWGALGLGWCATTLAACGAGRGVSLVAAATLLVVLGHAYFVDRWVTDGKLDTAVIGATLLLLGAILYPSGLYQDNASKTGYFFAGNAALVLVSSALVRLPARAGRTFDGKDMAMLGRSIGGALVFAVLYFRSDVL